jgi:hypothetical protein
MSGRVVVPEAVIEGLQSSREVAEEAEGPVGIEFGGVDFDILPRGLRMHKYRLEHPLGVVAISPSEKLPPVLIQPRAEFLHRVGPEGVVRFFRTVIEREMGAVKLCASRLDLYVDVQGWDLSVDERRRFVSHARNVVGREKSDLFNGLEFGARGAKTIRLRIYDKTIEIAAKGGSYVEQTWNDDYDPSVPVLRVEFEVGRTPLTQYGIDTAQEAIDAAPGLWRGLSERWLTYRVETADSNKSRWPIAPEWIVVQQAALGNNAIGLDRMIEDHALADLKWLRPRLTGCAARVTAIKGGRSIADAVNLVAEELHKYEVETGRSFDSRVAEKLGERSFTIPESLQ